MQQAVMACMENGVTIGAHPSYPDVANFGRSSLEISLTDLAKSLQQQIQSLADVCDSQGTRLSYIKPHGALYNDIMMKVDLFDLVVEVVAGHCYDLDLMLGAVLSVEWANNSKQSGVHIIREAFADRQYLNNGQLAPRDQKGAVFTQEEQIYFQAKDLSSGIVKDELGNSISLQAESICIHGDNPASVESVQTISQMLDKS
ncbi:UNVERIFIED_CONTAM: hypothetical protein GTU68_002355 [Idotea baltica]|nr:hypothetical protein [Idotea baltica]